MYGLEIPKIYIPVGLPRCGKSTWALKTAEEEHAVIVCADDIRLTYGSRFDPAREGAVHATKNRMFQTLLLKRCNIIVDECHHTKRSRSPWVKLAQERDDVLFVLVQGFKPPDEAEWRRRCAETELRWEVVESFRRQYQKPDINEQQWFATEYV